MYGCRLQRLEKKACNGVKLEKNACILLFYHVHYIKHTLVTDLKTQFKDVSLYP